MADDPQPNTNDDSRKGMTAIERKLKQIRDDFSYVKSYWQENYDEAAKDMDVIAAKPPKTFSDDRPNRPVIWPDETTQYVNQANNNLRQNKRSIKLSPKGEDAKDEDAEHRQAYLRGIEDASNGQAIYTTGYESAVQCGFGFWRVTIIPTGKGKFEPRLKRIPNYATVYEDPDAKEADFSDANIKFVIDTYREGVFARKFPKAQKRSFTAEDRNVAPDWLNGDHVVVAEYWEREEKEAPDGEKIYEVRQYLTNGVELLPPEGEPDKDGEGLPCIKWIGSWIPLIGVFGKEIYVKNGGQSKRMFLSMIRNGRSAQQMLAYYASQEAEEVGMAPRAPLQGYKGQFINADKTWKVAHKIPLAYIEAGIPLDWKQEWGPPPLPTRAPFEPNLQAYEIGYERWRRVLQASVAGSPLPTDAQKVNDKSGVALTKISDAGMLGNFHFTDNFVRALHNSGMQLDELITKLAESSSLPDQLLGKDKKGDDVILHVRGKDYVPPESSEDLPEGNFPFMAHRGKFTVTIADGPSFASEREERSDFADHIWEVASQLQLPPQITMKLLGIATKMKNIGALGDEIADLLDPKDQSAVQLQQAQMQIQEFQKQAAALAQEVQQLKLEKAGKVIDNEYRLQVTQLQNDIKVLVAEIGAKAQSQSERLEMFMQFFKENHDTRMQQHDQSHDLALQKDQQGHDAQQSLLAQQAAAAQAQQQPDQPQQP